jgi:hypothetical protein
LFKSRAPFAFYIYDTLEQSYFTETIAESQWIKGNKKLSQEK